MDVVGRDREACVLQSMGWIAKSRTRFRIEQQYGMGMRGQHCIPFSHRELLRLEGTRIHHSKLISLIF